MEADRSKGVIAQACDTQFLQCDPRLRRVVIAGGGLLAQERLCETLATIGGIDIIDRSASADEALRAVMEHDPDIVFFDVSTDVSAPGLDAFDVVTTLSGRGRRAVILTAANTDFAARAYDVGAVDYLLKPFDDKRLMQALHRADTWSAGIRELSGANGASRGPELAFQVDSRPRVELSYITQFPIRSSRGLILVRVADVERIRADGNYVQLRVGAGVHLARMTMKSLETRLDPRMFARVSRSLIVNIDRVVHAKPRGHGEYTIVLQSGARVRSGRGYRSRLALLLGE